MAAPPEPSEAAREKHPAPAQERPEDDRPELLIKLQERKERHAERGSWPASPW